MMLRIACVQWVQVTPNVSSVGCSCQIFGSKNLRPTVATVHAAKPKVVLRISTPSSHNCSSERQLEVTYKRPVVALKFQHEPDVLLGFNCTMVIWLNIGQNRAS